MKAVHIAAMLLCACLVACAKPSQAPGSVVDTAADAQQAALAVNLETLSINIRELSSDAYGGRKPASPGEDLTVAFLEKTFRELGLEPANGDSYLQQVPLIGITAGSDTRLSFVAGDTTIDLPYGTEQVLMTRRVAPRIEVADSEVVFVGYGINAPERGWNDYAGVDVRGKTVLMLINDPGFATGDDALFDGKAMTYYGRWTYKYDEAGRQGAAGVIIIHDTAAATYPWRTVENSNTGTKFHLVHEEGTPALADFEGWISNDSARSLLQAAGQDLDGLAKAAATPGFKAIPLGIRANAAFSNSITHIQSRNVAGVLRGSSRPAEAFIYMAHWDHIGSNPDVPPGEDGIFNGAYDNASGTAGLIELARAFGRLTRRPQRSILFLAVTAEEQNLLGSAYYAAHPLFAPAKTAGGLNMDGLNIYGPTRDMTVVGLGNSELDAYLKAALPEGRHLSPYPFVEKGAFFRSDQFELARIGVPMLYPKAGVDHVELGEAYGLEQDRRFFADKYHGPEDEWSQDWDLRGAVEDLQVYFRAGLAVANADDWPQWAAGADFSRASAN